MWHVHAPLCLLPRDCHGCLQYHGKRNDQNGARSDYIFTADAADYAAQLRKLQQHQEGLPADGSQPQQQPQQPVLPEAFSISLTSALSSAFILRVSAVCGTVLLCVSVPAPASVSLYVPTHKCTRLTIVTCPCLVSAVQELRWTDHAPVVLQLQLPPQAVQLLRSPAADPALQAVSPSAVAQHQTAAAPAAASLPNSAASPVTSLLTGTAAAAAEAVGLPCLLSSWWLMHPEAAAAAASGMLAAAGVLRTPPEVLTCSILQQLRDSQHSAARQAIAARARQLYAPSSAANPGAPSGDEHQPAASSQPAATQLRLSPSTGQQPAPGPQTPAAAGTAAVGSEQTAQPGAAAGQLPATHAKQQQQKRRWRHAKKPAAGRPQAQPPVVPGSKRKGRGWAVVSMGDGRTATVACSSSDDSDC